MTNKKIGRNSLCPCGSGKKYKKCCLRIIDTDNQIKILLNETMKDLPDVRYEYGVNRDKLGEKISAEDIGILHDGFFVDKVCFDKKKELIEKISSYDLKNTDITIIKKDFNELIEGEIKTPIPLAPTKFFRVRKNDIQHGLITGFSNTNELKYPPANFVKTIGRLNDVGESIFYAAPLYKTAVEECHINNNDFFTLSEYELKNKNEPIYFWALGIDRVIFKFNFPRSENTYEYQCFMGELKSIEDKGIQKFLFDEFTKEVAKDEEYNYKTTVALASRYLEKKNTGIIYTSIACNSKVVNLALPPKVFDDNLIATKCWLCQKKDNKISFLQESKKIDSTTGKIHW